MSKARDLANAGTALTTVSATELGYLDGVTSAVQTQINSKIGSASAINPTIVDAKGDIIAATAADTVARLAVGSNGQLLAANSATATGLEWQTVSSGGMTLITTTTFNNTTNTYTYSSLGSYKHLLIVIDNINTNAGASISNFAFRMNGITSADYHFSSWGFREAGTFNQYNGQNATYALIQDMCMNSTQGTAQRGVIQLWLYDYAGSTRKVYSGTGRGFGSAPTANTITGFLNTTDAITSFTIFNEQTNNFNNGTLKLYGVS